MVSHQPNFNLHILFLISILYLVILVQFIKILISIVTF